MSRLLIVSVLAFGLIGEAAASSHSESPYRRGTTGRAVATTDTLYDQLSALYHTLMGDTPAPVAQPAAVQVRRPGTTPSR